MGILRLLGRNEGRRTLTKLRTSADKKETEPSLCLWPLLCCVIFGYQKGCSVLSRKQLITTYVEALLYTGIR